MKIAMAQINPVVGDIYGNRAKIIDCIHKARSLRADMVVFPEMAAIGYPPMDLLMSRKLIKENLETIDAVVNESMGIAVVCGYVDNDADNAGMLYNAAAFIHDGSLVSKHFKTLLPTYDVFDEARYFSVARDQKPAVLNGCRIGITVCEDIWNEDYGQGFIEGRRYETSPVKNLVNKKIDLLVNISASPYVRGKNSVKWKMIANIAAKNKIPIVYVNQVGGNDSLIFDGASFAINSKGAFVSAAKSFEEDLIVCDTDSSAAENLYPLENNIEDVRRALVLGLRDYVHKCGFKKVILGLSGGIDSALTAALAVQALGADNVTGFTMPTMFSSRGSVDDSYALAKNLGIKIETIPIADIFTHFKQVLAPVFKGMPEGLAEENMQARIRGNILMSVSNKFGYLLLTTGNKSELAMGYCTMYGDMAGGLAVISDLPKMMVYELSKHINKDREIIPVSTIEKAPSAELRENQKDEDSLPPYPVLDGILELYIENGMTALEIIERGFDERIVNDILRTVDRNEYKRRQAPPGLKVTGKAFGIGRRLPMAQRFVP